MKFLPLIWKGIWRKRGRAILILLQIVVAFTLFGLLQGLNGAVKQAIASTHADRLYVVGRSAMGEPLPLAYLEQIRGVPGVREVVVSDAVRKVYRGFELGDRVTTRGSEWVVVGVFEEAGHTYDQTIVTDLETMLSAFGRNTIQQISVVLVSPDDFPRFKEWLENDPTLDVDVLDPREYRRRTVGQLTNLIDFVSYFIGALMASGAICAALSSLYAAVDSRRREIATLRAIGFGAMPVVISVLLEGLLLAFGAALLGALIAWLFFNGNVVSTVGLTFPLDVSPRLVAVAIVWALAIGLLGGLLPAVRAACLPVAAALRDA